MKTIKGVTLMSLVITISVLIILSSIAIYSGVSILESSKLTAFTTQMEIMQNQVNSIYEKYRNEEKIAIGETYYEIPEIESGTTSTILTKKNKIFAELEKDSSSGIYPEEKEKYKYWNNELVKELGIEGVDLSFFINIEKRNIICYEGFDYNGKTYYTLSQLPDSVYNVEYNKPEAPKPTFEVNVAVEGKNEWRITISNIVYDGDITEWKVLYQLKDSSDVSTSNELSFVVSEQGTYEIQIANGDVKSDKVECKCKSTTITDNFPGDITDNGTLDGTPENPYKIGSAEDLIAFSQNKNKSTYSDKTIVLTQDLDLLSESSYANAEDTELFGDYNGDSNEEGIIDEIKSGEFKHFNEFAGTLDGDGNTISNFQIKSISESEHYTGFLNDLQSGGCVKNLNVEGEITYEVADELTFKYHRIGGLVGRNDGGTIENCSSSVNITANLANAVILPDSTNRQLYIGGITANNEGLANNCINRGNINVTMNRTRPAIVNADGTTTENTSSAVNRIGGLFGENQGVAKNCINYGNISYTGQLDANQEAKTSVNKSDEHIGGITGYSSDGANIVVENCINLGNITTDTMERTWVGGIAGYINNHTRTDPTVSNVYNRGLVTAKTHNTGVNLIISGIVGNADTNMEYCFNMGQLSHILDGESHQTSLIGAITGDTHSDTSYAHCRFLKGTAPSAAEGEDGDRLGHSIIGEDLTEQMVLEDMNTYILIHNQTKPNDWKSWLLSELN